MDKRYIELKVTLTSLGVNITELDRIKSYLKKAGSRLSDSHLLFLIFVFPRHRS